MDNEGIQHYIMKEEHHSCYSLHSSSIKMYHDIKEIYWWQWMNKDIAEVVAQCRNFRDRFREILQLEKKLNLILTTIKRE